MKTISNIRKLGLAGLLALGSGCAERENTAQQPKHCTDNVVALGDYADHLDIVVNENQKLGDERETLTDYADYDFPSLLKGSKFGNTDVNQWLHFTDQAANAGQVIASNEDSKTRTVTYGQNGHSLFFKKGDPIFNLEVEMEGGFMSNVDSNGNLTDIIGQNLNVLGDQYRILKAKTDNVGLDLTMVTGAFKTQDSSNTVKHTIAGKDYTVVVQSASQSTNQAEYKVNGEATGTLNPGDMFTLSDGTIITHASVKANGTATDVEYALPARVLNWIDGAMTDNQFDTSKSPKHDGKTIEDALVRIRGQWVNGKLEIQKVDYRLNADGKSGDVNVGRGETLRELLDEPEGLASLKFDLSYAGQREDCRHVVRVIEQK
ncbi:MAG TPA: hypothetical protein VI612_02855 [Candidatus Nanoarchaeia archaeon]|nr:hypothetical protein [Candidatus Nanoarchaeia archaeon]